MPTRYLDEVSASRSPLVHLIISTKHVAMQPVEYTILTGTSPVQFATFDGRASEYWHPRGLKYSLPKEIIGHRKRDSSAKGAPHLSGCHHGAVTPRQLRDFSFRTEERGRLRSLRPRIALP